MDDEKKLIKKKYKKRINEIIKRYSNCTDDLSDLVDVFNYREKSNNYRDKLFDIQNDEERQSSFLCTENNDSISFIRNEESKIHQKNKQIVIFQDIYKNMCMKCNFEDIYRIFK